MSKKGGINRGIQKRGAPVPRCPGSSIENPGKKGFERNPVKTGIGKDRVTVLAVDPGINGAFVLTDGIRFIRSYEMPVTVEGRDKLINFTGVHRLLEEIRNELLTGGGLVHVFLERAVPMAMGSKGAFTYGRGFEALVIAIGLARLPCTLVEPSKWTKEMHEGTKSDLKPKARSLIAVKRLYPSLVRALPVRPKGGLYDGPVDALLIAGYGLRRLNGGNPVIPVPPVETGLPVEDEIGDFF